MLTEGGIRVPFIAYWHGSIPASRIEERAVISMDAVATSLVAAGLPLDDRLMASTSPYIRSKRAKFTMPSTGWAGQYAIRSGDWKYLKAGNREYLFDLASQNHEYENLLKQQPAIGERLKRQLIAWSEELYEPGSTIPLATARTLTTISISMGSPLRFPRRCWTNDGSRNLKIGFWSYWG